MPPVEFAERMSSSIHAWLSSGGSGSSNTNRSGMLGWSHSVLRPVGCSSGCFHETVNDSPRLSFVMIATFR